MAARARSASTASIRRALQLASLEFSPGELKQAAPRVATTRTSIELLRAMPLRDDVLPAFRFDPRLPGTRPAASDPEAADLASVPIDPVGAATPADLAFASLPVLAGLIRSRQVSCVELAEFSLDRLRQVDPDLHCVVTLTPERALRQAAELDAELAAGHWRGPLHGLPWGAKDLLAVRGYPTTWGAGAYVDQAFDYDAAVVERLDAAGAVLVAKLSMGELAMGDVWFGGKTRNPWDLEQGSSGSSAGSAAAVAAGAIPFAIGSETKGSIVSPSERCGCTGLRPTFGRVSRYGAMSLAPTMDKLGPMARSADDCALVLNEIIGPDPRDETVIDRPFAYPAPLRLEGRRVGVVEAAFERDGSSAGVLDELRSLGAELVPMTIPDAPYDNFIILLEAEAGAMFDDLTRSEGLAKLVRQADGNWPNIFRSSRLVPAVEYIRANRLRRLLTVAFDASLSDLDLVVHPTEDDDCQMLENLTGHPAIAMPWGADPDGHPGSVTFTGHLDGESELVALARAWQESTGHYLRHPRVTSAAARPAR